MPNQQPGTHGTVDKLGYENVTFGGPSSSRKVAEEAQLEECQEES